MDFDSLSFTTEFAFAGGFALALAAFAGFRERQERKRRDLDRISTVPWTLVSALCSMLAIVLITVALRGWLAPGAG